MHNATIRTRGGRIDDKFKKIKGRLVELGMTQKDISSYLGISQPTVNQKINNIRPMGLDEAEKIADLLQISSEEFKEYFFV